MGGVIGSLDKWARENLKAFRPGPNKDWFAFFPIPAAYELLKNFPTPHDIYNPFRIGIVLGNAMVGWLMYGIPMLFAYFTLYLTTGTLYYLFSIYAWPVLDGEWTGYDPCMNPVTRGGGTGGGGAC